MHLMLWRYPYRNY